MEAEDYRVLEARDLTSGVATLESTEVHVLIVDYDDVPSEHGDPVRPIEEAHPDLPVIVLRQSQPGHDVLFRPWQTEGNRRTLAKPFNLRDLIAAAREATETEVEEE